MLPPQHLLAAPAALFFVASLAVAADRRIEGTVKAVDAERSTVTITTRSGRSTKDETLDVVKKARVTVNGQPAPLKDVRRGQQAVAVFNAELEVVTRLDANGEGIAPLVPEITVVNELPEPDGHHTGPWPSADGLTLYWKTQPGLANASAWIWSARRSSKDALFEDARRLVPGSDMTATADGLELILLQGDSVWVTTRPAIDAAFVRPRKIAELQGHGFLSVPCLSGDDLVLYLDRALPDQPAAPVKFVRANRRAKWTGPTPVKLAVPLGKGVRFFSVTLDGSRAFCLLFDWTPGRPADPNRNEVVMMRAERAGFGRPEVIRVGGEPLRGIFPRYVAATNELFFARAPAEGQRAEIAVIRNFDPDAIEAAPVAPAAASKPARPDRELLQGRWVSVSETLGGKPLTPEQIRDMNKRLEVKRDQLVIRRTGLGGRFGVYEGTIRLDPTASPKSFDWDGKTPDGAPESWRGIYQLEGDLLRLGYVGASSGEPRPAELRSDQGTSRRLVVFKRER
jgi:uncharacterized protein (TIGR03067 family)